MVVVVGLLILVALVCAVLSVVLRPRGDYWYLIHIAVVCDALALALAHFGDRLT